jgi:putative intracellular protease/amidase
VILFNDFETLDAFGPVEIIGRMPKFYKMDFFSISGGVVLSSQRVSVNTLSFSAMDTTGVLLIPGGAGTRKLVDDVYFIDTIRTLSQKAQYVLTVCTGSALLAKTGLLQGRRATSNKLAFDWVCGSGSDVHWVKRARWTNDDKYYTSSGVSAGMDMTLGFVHDLHGNDTARDLCRQIEYIWNEDKDNDPSGQ